MGTRKFLIGSAVILLGAAAAAAQTPAIDAGRIYNAASFQPGQAVAPGSLVALFGTNIASDNTTASSVPLPATLGNVSVTFNNVPAPISGVFHDAANGDQITAQVPWNVLAVLPPGTTNVQMIVSRGGSASAPVNVPLTPAAPGIFAVKLSGGQVVGVGSGQAIAYGNTDGMIAAPAGAITGLTTKPAKIADPLTLQILATGLGPVDNPPANGDVPKNGVIARTTTTPTVLVGGVQAQVVFSGLSPYVGVYQLNIVIAAGTPVGDAVPLQIEMNGIRSSAGVTIAVGN
jgi:uncharacterized protein (TIGR03437 family)